MRRARSRRAASRTARATAGVTPLGPGSASAPAATGSGLPPPAASATVFDSNSVSSMKLARLPAASSPSGFAGSVKAAPGARVSGRGAGESSVGSVSNGAAGAATMAPVAASSAGATPDTGARGEVAAGGADAAGGPAEAACRSISRR